MQSYDPQDKESKEKEESPARTSTDEEQGDFSDSTTPLTNIKNKKRVHYPYINGERPASDTDKTDLFQNNHEKTTSGKRKIRDCHKSE